MVQASVELEFVVQASVELESSVCATVLDSVAGYSRKIETGQTTPEKRSWGPERVA